MEYLAQHIESLIFTTEHPINIEEIQSCLEETFETPFEQEELEETLEGLKEKYKEELFSFELVEIANGFQFLTKGAYHQTVGTYLKQTTKKRLSKAAIETLSITAYKQPVSKSELEKIRGVSCDYSIQKLLEKELVTILGRAETPGRPLLYGTTEKFMDYFGIKSLKDLPKPKDFKAPDSEVGEAAPLEEEVPTEDNTNEAPSGNEIEMEKEEGISNADVSLEELNGVIEQTEDKIVDQEEGDVVDQEEENIIDQAEDESVQQIENNIEEQVTEDNIEELVKDDSDKKTDENNEVQIEDNTVELSEDNVIDQEEGHAIEQAEDESVQQIENNIEEQVTEDNIEELVKDGSDEKIDENNEVQIEDNTVELSEDNTIDQEE